MGRRNRVRISSKTPAPTLAIESLLSELYNAATPDSKIPTLNDRLREKLNTLVERLSSPYSRGYLDEQEETTTVQRSLVDKKSCWALARGLAQLRPAHLATNQRFWASLSRIARSLREAPASIRDIEQRKAIGHYVGGLAKCYIADSYAILGRKDEKHNVANLLDAAQTHFVEATRDTTVAGLMKHQLGELPPSHVAWKPLNEAFKIAESGFSPGTPAQK